MVTTTPHLCLLEGAFRPENDIVGFRAYLRQRGTLVRYANSHIQHTQKAMRQMNLLLDNVVTDITGKTGMSIIRAILSGQRDPEELAGYIETNTCLFCANRSNYMTPTQ